MLRQTISREMPTFTGQASEWAGFIGYLLYSTKICRFDLVMNSIRLANHVKGRAEEAVGWMLSNPSMVPDALDILFVRFGRIEYVVSEIKDNILRLNPLKDDDCGSSMITFATEVLKFAAVLTNAGTVHELYNNDLMQQLFEKLTPALQSQWADIVYTRGSVGLRDLGIWLMQKSMALNMMRRRPVADGRLNLHIAPPTASTTTGEGSSSKDGTNKEKPKKCPCCQENPHCLDRCEKFRKMGYVKRWATVRGARVCFACLNTGHHSNSCRKGQVCGIDGCKFRHHRLLHKREAEREKDPGKDSGSQNDGGKAVNFHHSSEDLRSVGTYFKILPVNLYGPLGTLATFAFLDEGSNVTLLEQSVAGKLGLKGRSEPLRLHWTGDTMKTETDSRKVSLQISGMDPQWKTYPMYNVNTIQNLGLPTQSLNLMEITNRNPHLQGLPLENYNNARPTILIGLDHQHLIVARELRAGKNDHDLMATRTRLGWLVHGDLRERKLVYQICKQNCECREGMKGLSLLVEEYFSTENIGVQVVKRHLESLEDQRANKVLEQTLRHLGDKFECGLLWRSEDIHLPESYSMALRRLQSIERKMARDETFKLAYTKKITELFTKGYARKLSQEEIESPGKRRWFLPHFAVTNPNKPGKLRVVFDCAAETNGVSLNSQLLKGPDLFNSLLDVLFKFREGEVAISGDVREMFLMVQIKKEDQESQCFLWRDGDQEKEPEIFMMQRMLFGAVCSPTMAHYIKNKNAEFFTEQWPRMVDATLNRMYVDDWLDSFRSAQEAISGARQIVKIHERAGMEIRNFLSNNLEVRSALPGETATDNIIPMDKFEGDEAPEKVLGMAWNLKNDQLVYQPNFHRVKSDVLEGMRIPTKREVLQILRSLFDPMGLLSNFTIHGKLIVQSVFRETCEWDESISPELHEKWNQWFQDIDKIRTIVVPRCYGAGIADSEVELHIFVDVCCCWIFSLRK